MMNMSMEIDVEYLNKLASLMGERARLEAKNFDSYIVYMNEEKQIVKEFADGHIEIIEEAELKKQLIEHNNSTKKRVNSFKSFTQKNEYM